jgi:HAE1 family hydrophobic/amphiphilic exporter-1
VRFPEGTPVSQADTRSQDIALLLRELPGVSLVHTAAGYDEGSLAERSLADSGPLAVRFEVQTEDRDASDVAAAAREALDALPGIRHELRLPQDSLSRLLGSDAGSGVRIEAQERAELLRWAESLVSEMQRLGAKKIELDTRPEGHQTVLRLDATRLRHHGLQAAQVLETLRLALRGETVGTVRLGDSRLEVRVGARPQAAAEAAEEQLASLAVPTSGGSVAVGLLGSLERQAVFPELHRHNRLPSASLRAEGFADWRALLASGPTASTAGRQGLHLSPLDHSALREARREIMLVFAFALLLIYLLLAAQFESLLAPLPILLCLPVCIGGSLLLLRACRMNFNLSSFLGILILTGTAVNGPILIATAASAAAAAAARSRRAMVAAAVRNLLPVAATTLTTMAALLPVAFTTRGGSALQSHMAVALIGGLAVSLPSALLLFPALHRRADTRGRS